MYVYVCTLMLAGGRANGGQRSRSITLRLIFQNNAFQWTWNLSCYLDWLTHKSRVLGLHAHTTAPGFYMWVHIQQDAPACIASVFLPELSPQTQGTLKAKMFWSLRGNGIWRAVSNQHLRESVSFLNFWIYKWHLRYSMGMIYKNR